MHQRVTAEVMMENFGIPSTKKLIDDALGIARKSSREKARLLDLGCHKGVAISQLANGYPRQIEAHGLSLSSFQEWESNKKVRWHVGHCENTRFPDNYFDTVISHFGITHAGSFPLALQELKRILAKGGIAIFNAPRQRTVVKMIKQAGLELLKYGPNEYRVYYVRKK